jgi:hypothetical protein
VLSANRGFLDLRCILTKRSRHVIRDLNQPRKRCS